MSEERLVSTKEAAEILKLTSGRIRQLLLAGALRGRRVGRTWVIDVRDLAHYQEQRREL